MRGSGRGDCGDGRAPRAQHTDAGGNHAKTTVARTATPIKRTEAPAAAESTTGADAATTAPQTADWKQAYRDYLAAYSYDGMSEPKFALVYLDADDVPELAICDGSYHAARWKILTYLDGLKEIGEFGGWGNFFYYERAGVIYSSYDNHGAWTANLYQVRDGEAVSVWEGKDVLDEDGNEIFFDADDNPISEEEYNAQEQQLSYDEDGYFITDENIAAYLK